MVDHDAAPGPMTRRSTASALNDGVVGSVKKVLEESVVLAMVAMSGAIPLIPMYAILFTLLKSCAKSIVSPRVTASSRTLVSSLPCTPVQSPCEPARLGS